MDDLDVKELLATAARGRPAELHPVHAVLRRRRRARVKVAGVAAGAVVLASAAALLVDPGVLSTVDGVAPAGTVTLRPALPAPRATVDPEDQAAATTTFNEVLTQRLPWVQGVDRIGESRGGFEPGEDRLLGWFAMVSGPVRTDSPRVMVSLEVGGYGPDPTRAVVDCAAEAPGTCATTRRPDGSTVVSGDRRIIVSGGDEGDEHSTVVDQPYAQAVYPDGRVVDASATLTGSEDRPLRADDTFPADSPVTAAALAELVTDPRLAEVPLP